jgi:hypothetical protein
MTTEEKLRALLGHAYQLAGTVEDCPVEILDAYSAAAQGEDFVIPAPFATEVKYVDAIHEIIDDLLKSGLFTIVDGFLFGKDIESMPADIILSYLTATLPAKSKLPIRPYFFKKCKTVLMGRGYPETIVQGLE